MTIVALDTATRAGGVALWLDGEVHVAPGDESRTHGERLPGAILELLRLHARSIDDVDHLAVIAGPGSFTGLRIGMASIQGLALATGIRVVPVPTLEAIADAWSSRPDRGDVETVITWMDGQRGDVFYAGWRVMPGRPILDLTLEARVGRPDDLLDDARRLEPAGPVVLVSPAAATRSLGSATADLRVETIDTPLALVAATIAARSPDRAVAPHALRPIYLRRPDAVLARDRARSRDEPRGPALVFSVAGPDDDLSDIEDLQRRAFTNPWRADAIRWELAHSDVARLYLARLSDRTLVAYCACWLVFDELHLNSLAVDETWRLRGIAHRLLSHVFHEAVAAGARSATLEVRRSNDAALGLYRGLGFDVEAVRREYYQTPREDALILWNRHLGTDR